MRRLVLILFGVAIAGTTYLGSREAKPEYSGHFVVRHVVDADTVYLEDVPVRIRLEGVDAPELSQAFGRESSRVVAGVLEGREVYAEYWCCDSRDRYLGRLFLETRDGRVDFQALLVEQGLAWSDRVRSRYRSEEVSARNARRGLFAGDDPMYPADWRKARAR